MQRRFARNLPKQVELLELNEKQTLPRQSSTLTLSQHFSSSSQKLPEEQHRALQKLRARYYETVCPENHVRLKGSSVTFPKDDALREFNALNNLKNGYPRAFGLLYKFQPGIHIKANDKLKVTNFNVRKLRDGGFIHVDMHVGTELYNENQRELPLHDWSVKMDEMRKALFIASEGCKQWPFLPGLDNTFREPKDWGQIKPCKAKKSTFNLLLRDGFKAPANVLLPYYDKLEELRMTHAEAYDYLVSLTLTSTMIEDNELSRYLAGAGFLKVNKEKELERNIRGNDAIKKIYKRLILASKGHDSPFVDTSNESTGRTRMSSSQLWRMPEQKETEVDSDLLLNDKAGIKKTPQ